MTIYSLDVLLYQLGTSLLFPVFSWPACRFLRRQVKWSGIPISWRIFQHFVVIQTVKGFGIVIESELDVFLELFCFFYDPADVGNLISHSSAFSKSSLNIWKFIVCGLLKPGPVYHSGISMCTYFSNYIPCYISPPLWCPLQVIPQSLRCIPNYELMLKIFQARFQQYMSQEIKLPTPLDHRKSKRIPEKHLLLLHWLH